MWDVSGGREQSKIARPAAFDEVQELALHRYLAPRRAVSALRKLNLKADLQVLGRICRWPTVFVQRDLSTRS
jgi:hypothetical protein